jgi:hypothetical protein
MMVSGTPSVDRGKQLPMRDSIPSKPRVFYGDPKIFSWDKTRVLVASLNKGSMNTASESTALGERHQTRA